jgi:anti-sigma regulatory factor (Ser/Thr protein kinase)
MSKPLAQLQQLSIEFSSDLGQLAVLRQYCRSVIENYWPNDDIANVDGRLQLAANEAVTNVIRHGYNHRSDQCVNCDSHCEDGVIHFDILHDGKRFVAPEETPEVTEPLEGGMGLFLIEQCVDQVTYFETPEGRQCIRLSINLP